MKVIFGKEIAAVVDNRITVLELDTFFQPGLEQPVTAYAVLENTSVPIMEIPHMEKSVNLHNTMMSEYRQRNWGYCEQALEHLQGKWGGEVDSFYNELSERIAKLKTVKLPDAWNGVVINNVSNY